MNLWALIHDADDKELSQEQKLGPTFTFQVTCVYIFHKHSQVIDQLSKFSCVCV